MNESYLLAKDKHKISVILISKLSNLDHIVYDVITDCEYSECTNYYSLVWYKENKHVKVITLMNDQNGKRKISEYAILDL